MTDSALHQTALAHVHRDLGAKMAPFAGWSMPLEYAGTLSEHDAVRANVGVFDVSHLGTVWIEGPEAVAVAARSFTNDATTLGDGEAQYSLCCDESGGIIDDLIVYCLSGDRVMVVPNAANTPAVVQQLEASAGALDATVHDASTEWAVIAVQGPASFAAVAAVGVPTEDLRYMHIRYAPGGGFCCRTGYTGERGVELVVPNEIAVDVFRGVMDAGATPCGLGARDTLRLEMGYPLHGNDISRDTTPFEAGLGWALKLDRDPFVGSAALADLKAKPPRRRLRGLVMTDRGIPRHDMDVLDGEGATCGRVTSGTFAPTAKKGIALAYVDSPVREGDEVTIDVRGRYLPAIVTKPPFVDSDPRH